MRTKRPVTYIIAIVSLLFTITAVAQNKKTIQNPYAEEARNLVITGNDYVNEDAFNKAESSYRQAIGLDPSSVPAKYNAGNNYYTHEKYDESIAAHIRSARVARTKKEKHKAFHNLGNAYYKKENYSAAVEAYKNALRNDPTDNETRYNLALAKKDEDKNGGGGGGDDNQEKDENKDKEKNEDKKEGDGGDKKEGEDGEKQETDDKGDEKEEDGEKEEDKNGKPEDKEKKESGGEGEKEKKQPQQPQRQQGQLSPQQVKNLLEAMRNEEQKTQEKINAQKQKGAKIKTEKDW